MHILVIIQQKGGPYANVTIECRTPLVTGVMRCNKNDGKIITVPICLDAMISFS